MNTVVAIVALIGSAAAISLTSGCSSNVSQGSGGSASGTACGTATGTASGTASGTPSGSTEPETHAFEVTIENHLSEAAFLNGNSTVPFGLVYEGAALQLSTFCSCERCGTGNPCMHGDPVPTAIELPPGESLTAEADLRHYSPRDVTEPDCPEAEFWGHCDEPMAFAPGSYELVVPYDDLAAITAQGLTESDYEQWGHTLWMEMTFGTVSLSQSARQPFELSGDSTSITIAITDGR